jgi:hypothetical protein
MLSEANASQRDSDRSGYAIPIASFDSDDGLGGGLRMELAVQPEGYQPYKSSLVLQSFMTLRGYQQHKLRWDRRGLRDDGSGRLFVHMEWRKWLNDGYWGLGGDTVRAWGSAAAAAMDSDDPKRKFYRYTLQQPFVHVGYAASIGEESDWSAYGAIQPKYSQVQAYSGSLLDEQQPHGMAGGIAVQLIGGIQRDWRDPEIAPRGGGLLEIGGRWAPDLHEEAGNFGGPIGVFRHYRAVGSRGVWAHRLMAEFLMGDVPFYEMVHWGGFDPIPGYGGAMTLRGIPFGRFRGPGKALLNSELRIDVVEHEVRSSHRLRWEAAPFVDLGTVFGEGLGPPALHASLGLGTRVILDDLFVGRLDLGLGTNPVEGGTELWDRLSPGVYLYFDHPY